MPEKKPRELRPKATSSLSVVPAVVTDRTSAAVVGLESREFRELVDALDIRHVRRGHRVIVRVSDLLDALGHAARVEPEQSGELPANDDDGGLLAALGRRRTPS